MKLRLLPKMLLGILLPAVLALATLTAVSVYTARDGMYQQVFGLIKTSTSLEHTALEDMLDIFSNGVVQNFAEVARTKRYLAEEAKDPASPDLQALQPGIQESADEVARNYKRLQSACIVNAKGVIIANNNPARIGQSVASESFFKRAMAGETCIENLINPATQSVRSVIARPVTVEGRRLGMVYVTLDLAVISQELIQGLRLGKTGSLFVINDKGVMLMHANRQLLGSDESGKNPVIRQIMAEKNGTVEYERDGIKRFAAFEYIPSANWIVTVTMNRDEAVAPVNAVLSNNLMVGSALGLLVALVIFLMARNLASTLRGGSGFVQLVADNDFVIPEGVKAILERDCSRGDELGDLAIGVRTMVVAVRSAMDRQLEQSELARQAMERATTATAAAEKARREAEMARREGMLQAAGRLETVVGVVSAASGEVRGNLRHTEDNAEAANVRMQETSAAMEEMNATVLEVARNAEVASQTSGRTKASATEGAGIVRDVVHSILEVEQNSLVLKNGMEALDKQALAISHIMNVISDIADQTNLLALNAAIEAARAGEAGRGFAVVADEVRKLAEKTMASTTDVAAAIRAIQASTHQSRSQVEATVSTIEKATALANRSGESLTDIVRMVEETEAQVRAIALASEQQSDTSRDITKTLLEVSRVASDNTVVAREAFARMEELNTQVQELDRLIDEMKRG